jgi:hypothetical protein
MRRRRKLTRTTLGAIAAQLPLLPLLLPPGGAGPAAVAFHYPIIGSGGAGIRNGGHLHHHHTQDLRAPPYLRDTKPLPSHHHRPREAPDPRQHPPHHY